MTDTETIVRDFQRKCEIADEVLTTIISILLTKASESVRLSQRELTLLTTIPIVSASVKAISQGISGDETLGDEIADHHVHRPSLREFQKSCEILVTDPDYAQYVLRVVIKAANKIMTLEEISTYCEDFTSQLRG